ncbi:MAG: type II secretion system F family protein [Chloroflexi bacterium]|nr:type II secretion system F family protein [Chloroflexota bacterium]
MSLEQSAGLIPALAFASVFLFVYGLQQALDRRAARLARYLDRFTPRHAIAASASPSGLLRRPQRFSGIQVLDRFLHRQGFAARLADDLATAALPLRVGEYLFIRWICALGLLAVANQAAINPALAALAALGGYAAPALYVALRRRQRLDRLDEQLVEALALIAGGLRAGYSFLQGVEGVVRELPPPIGAELKEVLADLSIGVTIEQALLGLARRAPTEDVDMVVTAMLIQRSTGGNLAEVLDNIAHTIRERLRIRREVRTLTAQERMSSYVVGALPIFSLAFLSVTNPGYLSLLFGTPHGQMMLVAAVVLEICGFILMRRIIDVRL